MKLTARELGYLGLCLEGFLFGFYSGIFAMLGHHHASKEGTDNSKWQKIIFYGLCVLYVLSVIDIALDIAIFSNNGLSRTNKLIVGQFQTAVFTSCDFITQSILIHRCWIMWDFNIRVIIIPSILAFAFLAMWMASIGSQFIATSGHIHQPLWGHVLSLTGVTVSMAVNALVTGLIVFRIFKVFHQVKSIMTSDKKTSVTSGERKLRAFIFIIIESAVVLFAIQLTRVVITITAMLKDIDKPSGAFGIVVPIQEMLNGIVPTITLLRVSMGLSFHDEPSFVEAAATASFQFAVGDSNQIPVGMGSIGSLNRPGSLHIGPDDPILVAENISQERRDDLNLGESRDIQMVDR